MNFESKLILIEKLNEKNKINVYKVYNLHFRNNHKVSCLWFIKNYQKNQNAKIMQYWTIKYSPLSYDNGFSFKKV
jgi:hypothetical protein